MIYIVMSNYPFGSRCDFSFVFVSLLKKKKLLSRSSYQSHWYYCFIIIYDSEFTKIFLTIAFLCLAWYYAKPVLLSLSISSLINISPLSDVLPSFFMSRHHFYKKRKSCKKFNKVHLSQFLTLSILCSIY